MFIRPSSPASSFYERASRTLSCEGSGEKLRILMKKIVVISLGGSLVVPGDIDVLFLKKFKAFIYKNLKKWRFIIVVGGGRTNSRYNKAAKSFGVKDPDSFDWIGIYTTWLNAQLVRTLFLDNAESYILANPYKKIKFTKPILLAGGHVPGSSTDLSAAVLAKTHKAHELINLSDIKYVYDKDPSKYRSAKPLKKLSWKDYRKIIGSKWTPRLNSPFDPTAAKYCQKNKLKVVVAAGRDSKNLQNILNGKKLKGTVIE